MSKLKKLLNKVTKKQIFIMVLILLIAMLIVFLVNKFNTDGMEQTKGVNVYYRTYTKKHGWSRWSKNGVTSGNKKDDILNIQVKVKPKKKGEVTYNVFSKKWSGNTEKIKNKKIKGIKFGLAGSVNVRYRVCYRTYNDKNKWLEWSCDGITNGNIKKNVKAIELKVIPKGVMKYKFLKDYSTSNYGASIGF